MPFTDCINFQGTIAKNGYGVLKNNYGKGSRNAHRVIWEKANKRRLPKGMCIMHLCDNRACINLKHLKLGTPKENKADMMKKGRWCDRKGEKHPLSKITNKQTQQIRQLYKNGFIQKELAKLFSMNQCNISRIINFKRRAYVTVHKNSQK